ncbi:Fused spore maturation proteins A and B [Fulvivirga imtechensis AK7]|uniref:Fused spore maturation proteins A and B n=1 Tax=Fulvivirga imtechensis AK7 TaxID=1237149 RepID=L8JUG3_9BACT|nr:nucleoside recognition domain-containing protein [Fulvivirga imtechensis]ELR72420.1 Fused spore maturation proteins A and B [Fulvivirga imtechensis AK7]
MVLNYIWISFFLIAFVVALVKLIFFQDYEIFSALVNSTFEMAKTGFEISLFLTGVMALWLGLMRIGEKGGMVKVLSKLVGPFFARLFPQIPRDHPATGAVIMNFSANMLGLDNAATPLGLKAMNEMQELNPDKETASDAQIMFLVLNTSGLSIIPLTILVDRSVLGAANPTDVFLPILLATFCSSIVGLITVAIYQKINLFDKVILAYLGGFTLIIASIIYYFTSIPQEKVGEVSTVASNLIIFSLIISFLLLGLRKGINIYETFIDGAKEGFQIAIKIIPYLIAILVAIGVFRASGALSYLVMGMEYLVSLTGADTDFVKALPTAIMKPLSGGAARGMMIETIETHGVDSFTGRMASIFRGATETTFYIVAVYFGSVNIKKTRYAITAGLIADLAGIIAAILFGYMFFH